jgi:hypothetical protein
VVPGLRKSLQLHVSHALRFHSYSSLDGLVACPRMSFQQKIRLHRAGRWRSTPVLLGRWDRTCGSVPRGPFPMIVHPSKSSLRLAHAEWWAWTTSRHLVMALPMWQWLGSYTSLDSPRRGGLRTLRPAWADPVLCQDYDKGNAMRPISTSKVISGMREGGIGRITVRKLLPVTWGHPGMYNRPGVTVEEPISIRTLASTRP